MSFDTRYRPPTYDGVLGQEGTIKILRQFVRLGKARQQSYVFSGPFGSGKTTLGRILARAILCESPTPEGDPCDKCLSCRSLLEHGTAEGYVEVDAATNSGKDQMQKVVDEIQFSTFSGRHRVYLFDEAHQLSPNALDAMLKPLEETVQGTQDKQLVCIFCTTEPEKMRATIFSRCATAFVVRPVPPDQIAGRLAMICETEGIEFDAAALPLIAEITECHIRDALKSLEGIAMLGPVNRENVAAYLHLDLNGFYMEILENLGRDLPTTLGALHALFERRSPATIYEKLSETAMLAYQVGLGAVRVESFRDVERLKSLCAQQGESLLGMAVKFSERPGKPTQGAIRLDIMHLHSRLASGQSVAPMVAITPPIAAPLLGFPAQAPAQAPPPTSSSVQVVQSPPSGGTLEHVDDGYTSVPLAPEAIGKRKTLPATETAVFPKTLGAPDDSEFGIEFFCQLLACRVRELRETVLGSAGRPNVDSP